MQERNIASSSSASDRESIEREYDALITRAGYRVAVERVIVKVTGDDRVSFLHGMCTNNVKELALDGVMPALFLTEHAHVIADCLVWATADALLIETERALWKNTRCHLEKLLVADDVEFKELADLAVIEIDGPESSNAVCHATGIARVPNLWRYVRAGNFMIANFPRIGLPAFTILADKARLPTMRFSGASEVGTAAIELVRVEHGLARVGVDTGEKTIALEARLESALSFTKGCYLGQETIERATARGGLKKRLYGLRFEDRPVPGLGASVLLNGKEVGRVSSVAVSPRFGALGLSILHQKAWATGTIVEVEDSAGSLRAAVSDLPFQ